MVKKKTKQLTGNILYWTGVLAIVVTHIAILSSGLNQAALGGHATINLVAIAAVVGGNKLK